MNMDARRNVDRKAPEVVNLRLGMSNCREKSNKLAR